MLTFAYGSQLPDMAGGVLFFCAFAPFLPFLPILKPLGLALGVDAYSGPTPLGFIVVIILYNIAFFALGKFLQKR